MLILCRLGNNAVWTLSGLRRSWHCAALHGRLLTDALTKQECKQ